MIITIQSINKRFVISQVNEVTSFKYLDNATRFADSICNLVHKLRGERPTIKILPIQSKPMAMKSKDYPAKKKAVVAKKKVVAKGKRAVKAKK